MEIGEIRVVEIKDLSRSGPGLGRDESGRVIFVPFSAPGEKVRVEVVEVSKRYAEGKIQEILVPSPDRVKPPCPVFTRCGGCEWQHVPYARQWQTKVAGLKSALERVGVPCPEKSGEFPAKKIWHYRNRVQLRGDGDEIGFLAKGSLDLVPIETCPIAREEINALIPSLRKEGALRGRKYKAEVYVDEQGTHTFWNRGHAAGGFQQVHTEQNEVLRQWISDRIPEGSVLLDLYGGAGNLSLGLAEKVHEVHCVDAWGPKNIDGQPENFFFHRSHVDHWIRDFSWPESVENKTKVAVLDPPREGLGAPWLTIVEGLNRLDVKLVLAVGCDSTAWAQDVRRITRHGFHLEEIGALDFFPQTHHVEALAVLKR
jgi:23S rRNA (uracil1939-C5)-methyltransferase